MDQAVIGATEMNLLLTRCALLLTRCALLLTRCALMQPAGEMSIVHLPLQKIFRLLIIALDEYIYVGIIYAQSGMQAL